MTGYDNYTPEINLPEDSPNPEPRQPEPAQRPSGKTVSRKKRDVSGKKESKKNEKPKKQSDSVSLSKWWNDTKAWITSPSARILVGIFLGCIAVYLLVSFLSYFSNCVKDQSAINANPIGYAGKVANAGGEGGARLSEFLINECFGLGSIVIIFWLGAISLKLICGKPRFKTLDFTIKCFVALITVSLIIGLITIGVHTVVNWGGYHGRYVNQFIIDFVGWTGAGLLCFFLIALFIVICLRDLVNWILRKKHQRDERRRIAAEAEAERIARENEILAMQSREKIDDMRAGEATEMPSVPMDEIIDEAHVAFAPVDAPLYDLDQAFENPEAFEQNGDRRLATPESTSSVDNSADKDEDDPARVEADEYRPSEPSIEESEMPDSGLDKDETDSEEYSDESSDPQPQPDTMVVNVNTIDQSGLKHFKSEVDMYESHRYAFPPFSLLRPGVEKISVDAEEQLENKERIRKTLLDFGIPIVSIEATVGPTVTLYEIVPDKGVKIAKIRGLVDDIALSLSAIGVRIIAPIPGKGSVGIEVANKDPQTVSMRTIIQSKKFQETKYQLPIALGSTISNDVYIADLAKMPHLLVAGATGQGKSVGLNAIIASLLYCKKPYQLKFVMIDPKQVEFSLYNKIKNHYLAMIPDGEDKDGEVVITDMQKVEATLSSLCVEMDNRYSLLKAAHTRNLEEYNNKIREGKLNPADGHRFLPYIVVIVDEFGDLVMVSGKNVETPIARLAQKARAVGMHVIIATQRPSTNVITGIIKANFPARISFKVASGIDSKTILDTPGAQQLIGRGDMLIFHNSEMTRVQCAFIDTPEVEEICDYVEKQPYPTGPYILPEPAVGTGDGEMAGGGGTGSLADRDPLFEEVARAIINSNTASTSSVQRHYSIGYNRAGKIMDQLEAAGIVGPSQGGKPRAVLVDALTLEDILATL